MPNVSVTIKTNRAQRTYGGDYAYVSLMNESGAGNRWEQEPVNWKGGLGLFFSGMSALRTVAEQEGDEGFKEAARAAMDTMALFDPSSTKERKEESAKRLGGILEKLVGSVKSSKGSSKKTGKKK